MSVALTEGLGGEELVTTRIDEIANRRTSSAWASTGSHADATSEPWMPEQHPRKSHRRDFPEIALTEPPPARHNYPMLILWIVWAALTSTVFVCGTVAWFMPAAGHLADPEKTRTLFTILAVFSGMLLTAALILRIRAGSVANIQKALREYADGRSSLTPTAEEEKDAKTFGDTPAETAVARHIFNGCAISWALAEAVAMHGFGLSHMSGNRTMYVSFALPALLFLLWARPPRALIRDEIARFEANR